MQPVLTARSEEREEMEFTQGLLGVCGRGAKGGSSLCDCAGFRVSFSARDRLFISSGVEDETSKLFLMEEVDRVNEWLSRSFDDCDAARHVWMAVLFSSSRTDVCGNERWDLCLMCCSVCESGGAVVTGGTGGTGGMGCTGSRSCDWEKEKKDSAAEEGENMQLSGESGENWPSLGELPGIQREEREWCLAEEEGEESCRDREERRVCSAGEWMERRAFESSQKEAPSLSLSFVCASVASLSE